MRFLRRSLVGLFLLCVDGWACWPLPGRRSGARCRAAGARKTAPGPARERVFAVNVVTLEPASITPVLTSFGEVRSRRTLEVRATVRRHGDRAGRRFRGRRRGSMRATCCCGSIQPMRNRRWTWRAPILPKPRPSCARPRAALELARDDVAVGRRIRPRCAPRRWSASATCRNAASAPRRRSRPRSWPRRRPSRRFCRGVRRWRRPRRGSIRPQPALARRQIALAEAERRLAETALFAEFAGTLSDVTVVEGGLVQHNERLARLIDPDALEVSFRVSTPQYARLLDDDGELRPRRLSMSSLDVLGCSI